MASVDFPSDLPLPRVGTFTDSLLETKVQDAGEVGAPRRRNRFTRALERFSFSLLLTDAQKAALYEFYATDLVRGVEACNWTHPVTSVVYEVVLPARPKATHVTRNLWAVELVLEEI